MNQRSKTRCYIVFAINRTKNHCWLFRVYTNRKKAQEVATELNEHLSNMDNNSQFDYDYKESFKFLCMVDKNFHYNKGEIIYEIRETTID